MILFVVIFDQARRPVRPTISLISFAFLHGTVEVKKQRLTFGVPVSISFPNEFIIFAH